MMAEKPSFLLSPRVEGKTTIYIKKYLLRIIVIMLTKY